MNSDLVIWGRRIIEKEAAALARLVDFIGEDFATSCEKIVGCSGTILVTGMGKSGLVARKWASTFTATGTRSYFLNPAEASHGDLGIVRGNDLLIALSFSGETDELGPLLRHAQETEIFTIGITGNQDSSLTRQTNLTLAFELDEEACPLGLVPTTSTTLMMALGDAFAMTLMQMRGFTEKDFARLHPGGSLGRRLWLRVSELMHSGIAIPVVKPNDTFEQVLIEMTGKTLGLAVVMDENRVLGIITDGDLRRAFGQNKILMNAIASHLMTCEPKGILESALAVEAREIMEKNAIQHLLVFDGQKTLAGVLHLQDLLRAKVL